jgi:diguanylate cyclase (GGDEF)-like protein
MRSLPAPDLRDDAALADWTSGFMWLASGAIGLAGVALPGTDRDHPVWIAVLVTFAMAWGIASLWFACYRPLPMGHRAPVTAAMMPVVAIALWATGGASSQVGPLLLFTVLFVAWFFPVRTAWPLLALLCGAYASPLLYDTGATAQAYPAKVLAFAVAVGGVSRVMQVLKLRLERAEAEQRAMAERDPLTGLRNRRSFDTALARAMREGAEARAALVLFDFDGFKAINDRHGHPAGDAVLRSVSEACRAVVRQSDCLARLGGDEFALIAPGAGEEAATRIVEALRNAIATAPMPAGVRGITATFGTAVAPGDGTDGEALILRADERLLRRKRSVARPAVASLRPGGPAALRPHPRGSSSMGAALGT